MEELATQFKALSDPARLKILDFLLEPDRSRCTREEGVCACDVEGVLGLSQPTVSHHMKLLVQAGFVTAEKRGRWAFYTINPDAFRVLAGSLEKYHLAPVLAYCC
ncbi:MAG: metalloregulator ArsR/SmtB family transcription factor [Truepera sp.]|nr:metalloregulator ArsR/SmtB family transcription factor [Truepera sp.]